VDPADGGFVLDDGASRDNQALKAVVVLLLIVQFGVWAQAAQREASASRPAQKGA
jgi:hypothetical protein